MKTRRFLPPEELTKINLSMRYSAMKGRIIKLYIHCEMFQKIYIFFCKEQERNSMNSVHSISLPLPAAAARASRNFECLIRRAYNSMELSWRPFQINSCRLVGRLWKRFSTESAHSHLTPLLSPYANFEKKVCSDFCSNRLSDNVLPHILNTGREVQKAAP